MADHGHAGGHHRGPHDAKKKHAAAPSSISGWQLIIGGIIAFILIVLFTNGAIGP